MRVSDWRGISYMYLQYLQNDDNLQVDSCREKPYITATSATVELVSKRMSTS